MLSGWRLLHVTLKREGDKAEKEPLNYDNKKKRELKIKSCGQKLISIINVRHRDHCQT